MISFDNLSTRRQGELLTISEAILWGFFPVISAVTFSTISPLFSAAFSLFFSLFFFLPSFLKEQSWKQLSIRQAWPSLLGASLLVGVCFYLLVFLGTALSSPTNVSILLLLEVVSTTFVFHIWGKERLSKSEIFGSICILFGAALVLLQGNFKPKLGDALILLAVLIAPFGNNFAKNARSYVSTTTLMSVRNFIAAIILLSIGFVVEPFPSGLQFRSSLFALLINGILILGLSKVFWIEAIHRIPISKAIALNSIFPVVTMVASFMVFRATPTVWQVVGIVPAIIGVMIIGLSSSK